MTIFASVIIILLSMLITASLQLVPGTFSCFYHYALGKTSSKKAGDRSLSFVLGTEIFVSLIWILLLITLSLLDPIVDIYSAPVFLVTSGILFAEAVAFLLFYFRRSNCTSLFISRKIAATLQTRARKASSRSDAIALGFFAGLPELIFTLPLYFISAAILLNTPSIPCVPIIVFYIIFATLPLFTIHIAYHNDQNLASITRFRTKLKPFIRIIIPIIYAAIALLAINLGVSNHG